VPCIDPPNRGEMPKLPLGKTIEIVETSLVLIVSTPCEVIQILLIKVHNVSIRHKKNNNQNNEISPYSTSKIMPVIFIHIRLITR